MIIEVTCREGTLETVKQTLDAFSPTGLEGVPLKVPESQAPRLAYTAPMKGHAAFFQEKARGVDGVISIAMKKTG